MNRLLTNSSILTFGAGPSALRAPAYYGDVSLIKQNGVIELHFSKRRSLSGLLVFSFLFLAHAQSYVLASVAIDWSDYVEIQPNLYVDDLFTGEEQKQAIVTLAEARQRVAHTYGELISNPIVIISANSNRAEKFGIKQPVPGTTHALPWGQYIPLNDKGNNVDVLAHELAHAETAHRIGYIKWILSLPVWFIEGVAMQVDYREQYNASRIDLPSLSMLTTGSEFNSGDITLNYTVAKYELASWLKVNGNQGLYVFLDKIRNGEDFSSVYKEYASGN